MEQRRRGQRLAVALALGVLSACTGSGTGSPSPDSASHPPPSPITNSKIAAHLAAAPNDCSSSGALVQHTPPWGQLFGSAPAFGAFYARPDPSAGTFHVTANTRRRSGGWAVKVLWVLQPAMTEPVSLSGQEVGTGWPIRFDPSGPNLATQSPETMRLDPNNPGVPSRKEGWKEYPSLLSFPEAGCYVIKATWADGSWQQEFGFGR